MANAWTKWYWADWMSDPKLRLCSVAARGLWMDFLCLCAEADPPGYLCNGKVPYTMAELSALVRVPENTVVELVSELERRGVFSRNGRGFIYSRRMVRDVKKSETAQKNGKNGGNPSLSKQTASGASDNQSLVLPLPEAITRKKTSVASNDAPIPSKRGTRLPPDWQPSEADRAFAAERGMANGTVEFEAQRFAAHHLAKETVLKDWAQGWRIWVLNWVKFGSKQHGQSGQQTNRNASLHEVVGAGGFDKLFDQPRKPDNGIAWRGDDD